MVTSKRILLAFILVFVLALAGCTGTTEETRQAPTDEDAATTQLEEATAGKSDTVTDDDDDDDDDADDDAEIEAAATESKGSKASGISEDHALDIALKDAVIAKKDTSNVKVNRETDDGIDKYEIEFHVGNKEYSYDINAKTGDILESDSEVDDDND